MRYLTADLPGTGGVFKASPEDFEVEEIPAYLPEGAGDHTLVFIEKKLMTTQEAVRALCRRFALREGDVGSAGLKDRHAVTRQWLSLPRTPPEELEGLVLTEGGGTLKVLRAGRHRNKLRTGHLRGNRFTLTLRETEEGAARAAAVLEALSRSGVPNRYGAQRFGSGGRNVEDGRRLCRGDLRVNDRMRRRFLVSAYQSALFNRYLEQRLADGLLHQALDGDLLQKRDSGGMFPVSGAAEVAAAQARLDAGELAVTGPMFGSAMRAPLAGSAAALREAAVLEEEGLSEEAVRARFAALGALAEGTRRPLLVSLGEPSVEAHPQDAGAVVLRFGLPPGSYATVVLEEVMKQPGAALPE